MKKIVAIILAVFMLSVCLVACNPETPDNTPTTPDGNGTTPCTHVYSGECDATCNTCGGVRADAKKHTDSAYDGTCDVCGEHAPNPLITNEEDWFEAFIFANVDNFTISWDEIDDDFGYNIYIASDGTSVINTFVDFTIDENGTKVFDENSRSQHLWTKVGDDYVVIEDYNGKTYFGMADENWFYDSLISEFLFGLFADAYEEFADAFNPATGQYEVAMLEDWLTDIVLAFEDGKLVKATCLEDGVPKKFDITYGQTEKIAVPDLPYYDSDLVFSVNADGEGYTVENFNNYNQTDVVVIPDTLGGKPVVAIDAGAFRYRDITGVVIPSSVDYIGQGAFFGCQNLESIVIPDGITAIYDETFYGCEALASIVIPSSVQSIGADAFYYCRGLKDVYFTGTEEQWNAIVVAEQGNGVLLNATVHFNYVPSAN